MMPEKGSYLSVIHPSGEEASFSTYLNRMPPRPDPMIKNNFFG